MDTAVLAACARAFGEHFAPTPSSVAVLPSNKQQRFRRPRLSSRLTDSIRDNGMRHG